jgi:hypothetical protein
VDNIDRPSRLQALAGATSFTSLFEGMNAVDPALTLDEVKFVLESVKTNVREEHARYVAQYRRTYMSPEKSPS